MILKKKIAIIFTFFYTSVYSQIPIHKVETDCRKNINFNLENKRSNILLIDSLNFIKKLKNEESINNFIIKNKPEISVAITSLDIIIIKKGNINFNKFRKSKYKPDTILNNFLVKNISLENFANIDKTMSYKIGVFMFWNFEDSLIGIEFVELKDNKYYLIYRFVEKNE